MNLKTCLLLPLLALPLAASAGSVRSMSAEYDVTGPDGKTYTVSDVNCSTRTADRSIWREASGNEWCGREAEGFCSSNKIRAAKQVCDREYSRAVERAASDTGPVAEDTSIDPAPDAAEPAPQENTADVPPSPQANEPATTDAGQPDQQDMEAQKEQLAIERERLRLKKERLELRRQEVELQKQELEIQRQLEKEKNANKSQDKPDSGAAPAVKEEKGPRKSVLGM